MNSRRLGGQAPQLERAAKGYTAEVRPWPVAKAGWACG